MKTILHGHMVTMSSGWHLRMSCDRCKRKIMDDETALVFRNTATEENVTELSSELALCEDCVEEVKREFIDENRDTNFIESD